MGGIRNKNSEMHMLRHKVVEEVKEVLEEVENESSLAGLKRNT